VDNQSNGAVSDASTSLSGFVKAPDREPPEVWEIGICEAVPFGRKSQSEFTNVGTAFTTAPGQIEMTLKPGISVSGTLVLRKKTN